MKRLASRIALVSVLAVLVAALVAGLVSYGLLRPDRSPRFPLAGADAAFPAAVCRS